MVKTIKGHRELNYFVGVSISLMASLPLFAIGGFWGFALFIPLSIIISEFLYRA